MQWQHQREDGVLKPFPPKYESRRTLVIPPFLAELLELLLASHDSEYVFRSIGGGLLTNANFTYKYRRPIADGRAASKEFERTRLGQRQTVISRRPLPEIPATAYAGNRLYLVRHGAKEWTDEAGGTHPRIAVETRMGHEVAGVEGLYSNVTTAMERRIMDSPRWPCRVVETAGQSRPAGCLMCWFMKFISTKSFMPFVYYRIALGIVIIVLVSMGALSPHAAESAG